MSDTRSIIIFGLVSALIICGGAVAAIALNDTNDDASDASDAYSSSSANRLFITSSDDSFNDDSVLVKNRIRAIEDLNKDTLFFSENVIKSTDSLRRVGYNTNY